MSMIKDSKEGVVNILFLSDLHYGLQTIDGSPTDYDRHRKTREDVLGGLIDYLAGEYKCIQNRKIKDLQTIDVIAIGGDVGWKGKDEDYREFKTFFLDRIVELELTDPKHIVVCLGNHDINRSLADQDAKNDKRRTKQKPQFKLPKAGAMEDLSDNLNPRNKAIMEKRFKHFEEATKALSTYGIASLENGFTVNSTTDEEGFDFKSIAAHVYGYCQPVPGVHFLVLNSAWDHRSAERDPDDSSKEVPMKGRLRVGIDTYKDAIRFLRSARDCGVYDRYKACPYRGGEQFGDNVKYCVNCLDRLKAVDNQSTIVATGVTIAMFHHPFYSVGGNDYKWLHESEISEDKENPTKNQLGKALSEDVDIVFNGHTHVTDMADPFHDELRMTDKKLPAFLSGALYSNDTYDFGCWMVSLNYTMSADGIIRAYHGYSAKQLIFDGKRWTGKDYYDDIPEYFIAKTVRASLISVLRRLGEYDKGRDKALPHDIKELVAELISRILELSKSSEDKRKDEDKNSKKQADSSHQNQNAKMLGEKHSTLIPD